MICEARPVRRTVMVAIAAAVFGAACLLTITSARATVAPSGEQCRGNVCSGEIAVGSSSVAYSYTQHISPDGQLRVRLDGGEYDTGQMISYIVFGLPAFSSWDKFADPAGGAVYLPEEDVNPGRTAYERRDPDGCSGCVVDQVMTVGFSGLADVPGGYSFNIYVIQDGETGSSFGLPFYVDAAAPSGGDESQAWPAYPDMDMPCADHDPPGSENSVDNDLDYRANCTDADCDGEVGDVVSGMLCEAAETTCNDDLDNDGDGLVDCLDEDCDGRVGRLAAPAVYCQYGNESGAAGCGDDFDNDVDGRTDCFDNLKRDAAGQLLPPLTAPAAAAAEPLVCWRHAAYGCPTTETSCVDFLDNDIDEPYSADLYPEDAVEAGTVPPSAGADCRDRDCAGNAACPPVENKDKDGDWQDAQCFNGVDDDLDTRADCADDDCVGIEDPATGAMCRDKEFDLGQRVMVCGNRIGGREVDDDGDGAANCADADCERRFGWCGPCPDREDHLFDSCGDGKDNDSDGLADCGDPDCLGRLGDAETDAYCAAQENTGDLCSDGFDNDGDGAGDCEDPSCAGLGPFSRQCLASENNAAGCSDGFDNDADGDIDCLDPGCAGIGACHAKDWQAAASCADVPEFSAWKVFTTSDPTIGVRSYARTHIVGTDTVEISGTGTYSSVTVVIGDNTDAAKYYPYAAPLGTCTLTGSGAADFEVLAVSGHAVMIYNKAATTVSGFDLSLQCPTPASPAPNRAYPAAVSVLHDSGRAEYGEVGLATRLMEATPPNVLEIETEGETGGVWKVPFGEDRRLRVIPSEPSQPDPLLSSGICGCSAVVGGVTFVSEDGSCVISGFGDLFESDRTGELIEAAATDGADNASNAVNFSLDINVTPVVVSPLVLSPSKPFFDYRTADKMGFSADFRTATNDDWSVATCQVYIRNAGGAVIGGPGPTETFPGLALPGSSFLTCNPGEFSLPAALADGEYTLSVAAEDGDGDFIETDRRPFYVCDHVPTSNDDPAAADVCHWADFDGDGAAEGYYTDIYSEDAKPCDNCVAVANPAQDDRNADGVGDECLGEDYGRCDIDRDYVCGHDSFDYDPYGALLVPPDTPCSVAGERCCASSSDPRCCPAPSYADDPDPPYAPRVQACRMDWGLCSFGGEVCFEQNDCPLRGVCDDAGTAPCNEDIDCALDGTVACLGADLCESLMYPWVQAPFGNVFSRKSLRGGENPPQPNATFCLTAKDEIRDFTSEQCPKDEFALAQDKRVRFEWPNLENAFSGSLGRIDVAGLLAGKYGEVVDYSDPGDFLNGFPAFAGQPLGGKVYVVHGDLTFPETAGAATTIVDASFSARGDGTVVVIGDLTFVGDVNYSETITGGILTSVSSLASIGWIVLDDGSGSKGNLFVDKSVTDLAGAFLLGGSSGFWSVAPPETESDKPLTVRGLVIARQFHLSRSFRSVVQGSERFIYDGRAVVNPPPGFADATRALPSFTDLPQ